MIASSPLCRMLRQAHFDLKGGERSFAAGANLVAEYSKIGHSIDRPISPSVTEDYFLAVGYNNPSIWLEARPLLTGGPEDLTLKIMIVSPRKRAEILALSWGLAAPQYFTVYLEVV